MSDNTIWFLIAELALIRIVWLLHTLRERERDEKLMILNIRLWLIDRGRYV